MSSSISELTHATLGETITEAVCKGREAANRLHKDTARVEDALRNTRLRLDGLELQLRAWRDRDSVKAAREFDALCKEEYARLKDVWKRRAEALGHFNIVLFGRTGAGKSSLMEALSHGDGQSVSPGQSDWTVDIATVEWRDCHIIDTPGIDGWGREDSRENLEQRAREAVESADIVLLCFDTQGQLDSEFKKIGRWVKDFGKPAVAVINNRNARWRPPVNPASDAPPARRGPSNITAQLAQHRQHICSELERLGLPDMPVVAINTKRALVARAKVPFKGPYAEDIATRDTFGIDALLQASNLPALEALLSEALAHDAPQIRLGMLKRSLRGDLARITRHIAAQHAGACKAAIEHDAEIATLLAYCGYPQEGTAWRATLGVPQRDKDLLACLEALRGAPFDTPVEGELDAQITILVESRLGPERAKSARKAELLVLDAFAKGEGIADEAFAKAVYDTTAIDGARQAVLDRAYAQIHRRMAIPPEAMVKADLPAPPPITVDGASGWQLRWASNALRVGKVGAGFSTIASLGTSIAAAFVLDRAQRSASGWAEMARSVERRKALAAARAAVDAHFDAIGDQLREIIGHARDAALLHVLGPRLRGACLAHKIGRETAPDGDIAKAITLAQESLVDQSPDRALAAAAKRIEQQRYPGRHDAGRLIWAGEDWIDDDHADQHRTGEHHTDPAPTSRTPWALSDTPQPTGAGRAFVARAEEKLAGIEPARAERAQMHDLAMLDQPSVVLAGDYNVGKTSLIRRLLSEAGRPVPDSLEVRADPTTRTVTAHDLGGFRLVDVPGYGSGRAQDDTAAAAAMTDASLVLWLVNGAVRDDTLARLCATVSEDRAAGRVDRWDRTLIVIGRGDDLFGDPRDNPARYATMAASKKREFIEALRARGIDFPLSRLFVVAADPHGSGDIHAHRDWDGIDALCAAIDAAIAAQPGGGIDFAIVAGSVARLSDLAHRLRVEQQGWQEEVDSLAKERLRLALSLDEGAAMRQRIETDIGRMIDETVDPLLDEFMKAPDEATAQAAAERLEGWTEDPVFVDALDRWENRWKPEIDRWASRTWDEIKRSQAQAEWQRAQIKTATGLQFDGLMTSGASVAGELAGVSKSGSKQLAHMADKVITRDNVYWLGKQAGIKFKPWGATKAAGKLKGVAAGAGKVLAVAGAALEIRALLSERNETEQRDKALAALIAALRQSRDDVRASLLGDDGSPAGAAAYLAAHLAAIEALNKQYGPDAEMLEARHATVAQDRGAVEAVVADGWTSLEMLTPKDSEDAR